jgi:hypothetical protein
MNGGATSSAMLPGGTGPMAVVWEGRPLDAPMVNAASWTRFASLLYIDGVADGYGYPLPPAGTLDPLWFNLTPAQEATEIAAMVIAFLECRADRPDRPVVLLGESMSGRRTALMLAYLRRAVGEASDLPDPELSVADTALFNDLVRKHLARLVAGRREFEHTFVADDVARQFYAWALIQPGLPNWQAQIAQQRSTAAFARIGPTRHLSEESVPLDLVERGVRAITDAAESRTLLGVALADIEWLHPASRGSAHRPSAPRPHFLDEVLGPLGANDDYYGGGRAAIGTAESNAVFVDNLLWVNTFITDAMRDPLALSYAIFEILENEGLVSEVRAVDERVYAHTAQGVRVRVQMLVFDSRHVVAWDRPIELANALESWLASVRTSSSGAPTSVR